MVAENVVRALAIELFKALDEDGEGQLDWKEFK